MVQLYIQLKPHFGRGILLYFRGCFFQFFEGKKKLYIELSQIVELYKTKIHFLVLKVHLSTLSQQNDIEEDALCAGMEILAWFLVEGKYY